jgi:hypothetical protein
MNVNRIKGEASMSDRIVADVRRFSKSTGYAKFLLLVIASHLHYKAEYAYPSLDTLARETTLSKPTVLKLIAVLVALGELEVLRGHGRGHANRYRITIAHEAPQELLAEDNDDQPKGKARADQHRPPGSPEDDADQAKGKPYLYLLPTPTETEKINDPLEKVNADPGKGKTSVDSKEVLRTSKDKTERVAPLLEKVKDQDNDEWVMQNRVYGTHRLCGAMHQRGTPCPRYGVHAEGES